jgi:hypothetical protein
MLKRHYRIAILAILVFAFATWIQWWASSGFILEHQICGETKDPDDCGSYNVIFYSAWRLAKAADHWGVLITAFATIAIGYFTYTLKQSTDKVWKISDDTLRHAISEAAQSRHDRWREELRFREQIDITSNAANAASMSANASTRQAHVAEAALAQLERPYIFVFGVRGIRQDPETQEFYVEYSVANYGKMPAIIETPHVGFVISDRGEPPIPPLLFDGHSLLASPILQAGEQRRRIREYFPTGMVGPDINVRIEHVVRAADIDPNRLLAEGGPVPSDDVVPTFNIPNGFDIFFRAVIGYRGPFTTAHETGVLWLYNPATFEFAVRGAEEHNYVR